VLKAELKRDSLLMLQLGVAKELGYTLVRLNAEVTLEELLLWSAYFDVTNEEQERRMKQRRR
jgi:polyphosphate kinase 2 (PPK2 family)